MMTLAVYNSGMQEMRNTPKNKIMKMFLIMILTYSDRENRANGPATFSTMKTNTGFSFC